MKKSSISKDSLIRDVQALQVLDSMGVPTIEVQVVLEDGSRGSVTVPTGVSTGEYEAVELRDGDRRLYHGRGVMKAVENVCGPIARALPGMDATAQWEVDARIIELDGSRSKRRLGANAMVGVSIATALAAAKSVKQDFYKYLGGSGHYIMPTPFVTLLSGGAHANNSLDIEEIMVVPHGAPTFAEAVRMATETFHALGELLHDDGYPVSVAYDGGYAPDIDSVPMAMDYVLRAIERAGYLPGEQISIAMNVAASELARDVEGEPVRYHLTQERGSRGISSQELIEIYQGWIESYPLLSIEDGLDENDWAGWQLMTHRLSNQVQLVGDDIFATSPERILKGIERSVATDILLRPNQVGTLSETLTAAELAFEGGYGVIVGHRSGEGNEPFLADLAVGVGAPFIKAGAPCRGERVAKYNRLLWIEHALGQLAHYNGASRLSALGSKDVGAAQGSGERADGVSERRQVAR